MNNLVLMSLVCLGLCQADNGVMLIPLYPEDVEWLPQAAVNHPLQWKSQTGKTIDLVRNSRFCSPTFITKLNDALRNAAILDPSKATDLAQLERLTDGSPNKTCTSCSPGLVRSLDRLVSFTDQLTHTAMILDPQQDCHCFVDYLQLRDLQVQCCSTRIEQHGLVDLVIAPFYACMSIDKCENIHQPPELIIKQDFLINCITALKVLNQGGTFVCRLCNSMTRFTVGLIYILHCMFSKITIVKPVLGSLWHSERYLVCKQYQGCTKDSVANLEKVLQAVSDCTSLDNIDVLEFVSMHGLYGGSVFSTFVKRMNEKHTHLQLLHIVRLYSLYNFPDELPSEEHLAKLRKEIEEYIGCELSN